MVVDDISRLRIPLRIAMPPHVDGNDAISAREVRDDVIERARHAIEAVDEDQRRLLGGVRRERSRGPPFDVVNAETVDGDKPICTTAAWRGRAMRTERGVQ